MLLCLIFWGNLERTTKCTGATKEINEQINWWDDKQVTLTLSLTKENSISINLHYSERLTSRAFRYSWIHNDIWGFVTLRVVQQRYHNTLFYSSSSFWSCVMYKQKASTLSAGSHRWPSLYDSNIRFQPVGIRVRVVQDTTSWESQQPERPERH